MLLLSRGNIQFFKPRVLNRRSFKLHSMLNHQKKDIQPHQPAITRFAPSPTGFLHIGSLRTALYNYLLAEKTGGKFILRLEDTDRTRLVPNAEEDIFNVLKWCKIKYESPHYKQSDRMKQGIYQKYIEVLLSNGFAYKCFCSKERLNKLRFDGYDRNCTSFSEQEQLELLQKNVPYTIRFLMPSKYPTVTDLLHGKIVIPSRKDRIGYDDPVLMKSDGFPTYHFANVVDDHLMNITHVIRGEEWLPSTPKHIAIYTAFNWNPPKYVHIPLLTNIDNDKKLSKRKGNTPISQLRAEGILPEALINFVALLGWSPAKKYGVKSKECYELDQLIELFNLNNLTKGNVRVDNKKLWYFNKHFLKKKINSKEIDSIVQGIAPAVKERFENCTKDKIKLILQNCSSSLSSLHQFNDTFYYFFERPNYNNVCTKQFIQDNDEETIRLIIDEISLQFNKSAKDIPAMVDGIILKIPNVDKKLVFETMRVALIGATSGPHIPIITGILGTEETTQRWNLFSKWTST